jgi:hypothetical protein
MRRYDRTEACAWYKSEVVRGRWWIEPVYWVKITTL